MYRDCLTGSDVNGWKPERAALAIEGWSGGIITDVGVGFDPGSCVLEASSRDDG